MEKNVRRFWLGAGSFVALVSIAFGLPAPAAALQISEVMYDPDGTDSGREWIEVWNDGSADVDLGRFFLLESDVRHKIAAFSSGVSATVAGGERAIIADRPELFLADYPDVAPVFDSAFSLSNSGERLALVDADGDEVSSAEWGSGSGATGGQSWQRSGVSWIAAAATPGAANADREETSPVVAPGVGLAAVSAHSGTGGITTVRRERALAVDVGRARVVPIGSEIEVAPEIDGASRASFSWSWGDGASSRKRLGRHSYRFPGTYAVVLNVRGAGGAVATSRTTVTAVEVDVSVAAIPGEDGAIEIGSRSSHEINLGGFTLEVGDGEFELPVDTILLPKGRIGVPNAISRLALSEAEGGAVALRRPDGKLVKARL